MRNTILLASLLLCLCDLSARAQDPAQEPSADGLDKIANFPSRLFDKITGKTTDLQQQLIRQTQKYLQRMARQEQKLKARLFAQDSAKAAALYAGDPIGQYTLMAQRLSADSSKVFSSMGPEYLPYADSLTGALGFLSKNPAVLGQTSALTGETTALSGQASALQTRLQGSLSSVQQLQAKLQYADVIKQYIASRRAQIQQALGSYTHLPPGISNAFSGYKRQAYYYADQVRAYRAMLNDPDKMMQTVLVLLNKLPAFSQFMQKNGFLAGLFGVPAGYGTPEGMVGMQTRQQVLSMIQDKVGSGGPNAASAIQGSLSKASQDITKIQNKLSSLGAGSGGMDMPDFKPNPLRTKTLWQRLEYGFNIQTTRATYYFPTYTDIGLSLGYKLGHGNTLGVGASYKLGWGSDWQHITLSSQGVGLRSFVDIRIKKSWSVTGGYELNNVQPLAGFQGLGYIGGWTQSGLIGVTKTISMKSTVFRKANVQLLWDFLSYYQVPQTPPIVFRVGYSL
jgi:hypothetical protein